MAEWRARGYVADSDEEEESQESTSRQTEPTAKAEEYVCGVEDGQGDGSEGRSRKVQDNQGANQAHVVEVRVMNRLSAKNAGAFPSATQVLPIQTFDKRSQPALLSKSLADKGSIDELQEDYYGTDLKAGSQTELPTELALDNEIVHPPQSAMLKPLIVESQVLPGSSPLQGRKSPDHRRSEPASTSSSPLSDVSSLSDLGRCLNLWSTADIVHLERGGKTIALPHDSGIPSPSRENLNARPRPARNLRQRNPIQLHPYAIEGEKYRQILHARGLKALRFAQGESQHSPEDQDQQRDTQCSGSQSSGFSSPCGQSLGNSSPPPISTNSQPAEDEFPDIDALLRRQSGHVVTHGYKRRKINKPTFKPPPRLPSRKAIEYPDAQSLNLRDIEDVYNVPPSPPLSGSQTPSLPESSVIPKFRVPSRLSPKALPTPLTSSEPRRPLEPELFGAELADNQSSHSTRSGNDFDSQRASSEDEAYHQLQNVQRKIRGVLPASWLKLDLKTQANKLRTDNRGFTSISPEKRSIQRGVARPITKARSLTSDRPCSRQDVVELSDNSDHSIDIGDGEEEIAKFYHLNQLEDDNDDTTVSASRLGEAMEDDQIDAMLPSARRKLPYLHKRKKRQTKMPDYGVESTSLLTPKQTKHYSKKPQHWSIPHEVQKPMPRFQPPKLSILDAPSVTTITSDPLLPKFLKIASKTVCLRRDKGRHSPSRKYLRLATRDDDYEANETLREWREGIIQPNSSHVNAPASPGARRPLLPRSANARLSPAVSPPETLSSPIRRATTSHRISSIKLRSTRVPTLRNALDSIIRHRSEEPPVPVLPSILRMESGRWNNAQKKRRQLVSSIKASNDSRPALLETLQQDENRVNAHSVFNSSLLKMNVIEARASASKPVLDRFLNRRSLGPNHESDVTLSATHSGPELRGEAPNAKLRRQRKMCPRRLEIPSTWSGRSGSPISVDKLQAPSPQSSRLEASSGRGLIGLGPFGTQYTSTFDITPFPTGTCFHTSTFIGSGSFQRSLNLSNDELDSPRGFSVFKLEQQTFRWGPWTDKVASELSDAVNGITQRGLGGWDAQKLITFINLQRHIVKYLSHHLSFLDPVDRVSFLQTWNNLLYLMELGNCELRNEYNDFLCQTSMMSLVITHQLRRISNHSNVPHNLRTEMEVLLFIWARHVGEATTSGLEALRKCRSDCELAKSGASAIRNVHSAEALVVALHVLANEKRVTDCFWDTLHTNASITYASSQDIPVDALESCWKALYSILPFLEFDALGVIEPGRRFKVASENWARVKPLINLVLDEYLSKPIAQAPSFNAYCRTLFSRCLYLINAWGWRRCDTIIGILFDFFARNGLNHLKNEESRGSPNFLQQLEFNPSLNAEPEDRCFHLLLKIIGSGLKYMRQLCPDKKVRGLIWRLMPNHGRSHPKEEAIREEDLDALRNHHDLLCTLYWASPPGFRPRLGAIRNLVHLESSHREACHINIRAWSNLVRFQLSTNEPISSLEPFTEWHDDLLQQIIRQHKLARTEAEEQVRSVQHAQGLFVSQQLLESTIAQNQHQVEAILIDALVCLQRAIQSARTKEAADELFSPGTTTVFSLFNSIKARNNTAIVYTLDIILAYIAKYTQSVHLSISSDENDDSQDYGDWTAFGDATLDNAMHLPKCLKLQQIHDPLRQLLSNCFGADISPNDHLLSRLVDAWTAVCQSLVKEGFKTWVDYIGRFGNDAWSSLRETEQTRKYSFYYLSRLIEIDAEIFKENQTVILKCWIESLVERESLLKFQHKLTGVLLDVSQDDSLLHNLPFWPNHSSGRYEITALEFSDRRLSLISSVLSNMRASVENAFLDAGVEAANLKQEYKELLKHLMTTMKHNYQELGHSSSIKGAYVDFVHRVIEFLQQHTSSICPIDRFFTDNTAFPLPATDPTYVVGQLKNYALRLQDPRAPKELAVFLQSVAERAAIDGQQTYLVDQLHTAMSGCFENGTSKPTLRAYIVKAIVPAYIEMAFNTTCGWILALPFLQALQKDFNRILLDVDGFAAGSVESVASVITSFLGSLCRAILPLLDLPTIMETTSTLKVLRTSYGAVTTLLPPLEYLVRLHGPTTQALQNVQFLLEFAIRFLSALSSNDNVLMTESIGREPDIQEQLYGEFRNFATVELQRTLQTTWISDNNRYFVERGASRKEVIVDIGLREEEKEEFKGAMKEFMACLRDMPSLSGQHEVMKWEAKRVYGLEDLMF